MPGILRNIVALIPGKRPGDKEGEKYNYVVHYVIVPIVTSIVATLLVLLVIYFHSQYFSDERAIRDIINQEAVLAKDHNVDEMISLYTDDAILRDAAGGNRDLERVWRGNQIEDRYKNLGDFTYLRHEYIDITVNSDGQYARAYSDTVGEYVSDGKSYLISNNKGEQWTFKKVNGKWMISYFTFNLTQ